MTSSSGPARPASPSNSFYALSDDEEGDYNTITHTTTGRGVKLLFSKSKVCGPIQPAALRMSQMWGHALGPEANIPTGIHPPHAICERQHPRLHRPPPTKAYPRFPPYILLLHLREIQSRSLPPPSLASRILPRRRPEHIRQSRLSRRRFPSKTIVSRPSTSDLCHAI